MASNNNAKNATDITGLNGKSPGVKSMTNASSGRVKTISGQGANLDKGGLSPRSTAAIVNKVGS